jgi:hypothetical protein
LTEVVSGFLKADATSDKLPTKPTKLNDLTKSGASKEDGLKMWGEVKGCEQQQQDAQTYLGTMRTAEEIRRANEAEAGRRVKYH